MKLNDKIKKLKVSYRNLIKDIQYDAKKRVVQVVLVGSLAPALVLASACTEEELLQAQHTIEQMTDNPDVIDTPDVVVEPPSVEPVVDDPVVEPEVVEPEEINPRDYSAVYDFDFEVPVYTEEEVEAARARFEENSIDLENEEIMNDYDLAFAAYKKCATDYYIANQDLIYYIYNSCKDADFYSVCQSLHRYYVDENNGFIYTIEPNCVTVVGELDDKPFKVIIGESSADMEVSIGEMHPEFNLVQIGPGSWVLCNTDNKLKKAIERAERYIIEDKDFPNIMVTDEEFTNCGFKHIELGSELSLEK